MPCCWMEDQQKFSVNTMLFSTLRVKLMKSQAIFEWHFPTITCNLK